MYQFKYAKTRESKYFEKHLIADGFSILKVKEWQSKTVFTVFKDGFTFSFDVPAAVSNVKSYYNLSVTNMFKLIVANAKKDKKIKELQKGTI